MSIHRRWLFVSVSLLIVVLIISGCVVLLNTPNSIKSVTVSVQGAQTKTPTKFTISPSKQKMDYSSPIFKTNFEFDAVAPQWQETNANDSNRTVSIRTSRDGSHWTDWSQVEVMPQQRDHAPLYQDAVFPEAPIISLGQYFQYKVTLTKNGNTSPSIQKMNMTYIDSRPSLQQQLRTTLSKLLSPKANAVSAQPAIISRADWGNPDPTGEAFKGTPQYWAPSYQQTSQIFIHHTVDSNYDSQVDGASVVRAIWQYHTYTLGWGDIGYNDLVDEAGNIYEGRAHGDNVVGGHVYGYNSGSAGIALIGCFQSNDSTCQQLDNNNIQPPSNTMLGSLTSLLAWKTTIFGIDPQAQHVFCKYDGSNCLNLYTIAGHRDAYPTSCPGDLTYQNLQAIRDATASKKAQQFYYAAQQVNYPTVNLGDNNQLSVTMQFRNVGAATWYNGGANPVRLATANGSDHASVFAGSGWLSGNRAANMTESSVPPGSVGSFTFNVANPSGYLGDWLEYFRLVAEGTADFGNFVALPITTRDYSFSYNSQNAYADSTKTSAVDLSNASPGQTAWLTFSLTNTGNTTWYNGGATPVRLGTDNSPDRLSAFCTAAWLSCSRPTNLKEASVAPGATGTFEFPIQVPGTPGNMNEYFTPLVEGLTWMSSPYMYYPIDIHGSYLGNYVSEQAYTDSSKTTTANLSSLSPGQTIFFSVQLKNTGDTTWYNTSSYSLRLGTSHPQDRTSAFYNPSWLGQNRPALLKESSVAPGQIGTLETIYSVPGASGVYQEYLQPVVDGITWLNDQGLYLPATVNGTYSWSLLGQQAYTDNTMSTTVDITHLTPGQRFYNVITVKNTGNTTWFNSGPYPLNLGTSRPENRTSQLYDSSWLATDRPAHLTETSLAPGATGHFGAYYKAPSQTGSYTEYFQPVADSLTWLNDPGLNLSITVQ